MKDIPSKIIPFSCANPLGMYQVYKFFPVLYSHIYAYTCAHTVLHYYKIGWVTVIVDLKYSLGCKVALDHAADNGLFSV